MSELSRLRGSEGYGACDDEFSVHRPRSGKREAAFLLDRRRIPSDGSSKYYDDETSDLAGERIIDRRNRKGDKPCSAYRFCREST